ncbi:ASTER-like protein [Mya arenaria]|uniref:ASTER-like protein n=1 Tax=Mya arenaria TaxID=6604 RepID=A0ABY7FTZ9_MYAAR|nr:ASTER-like protein [Mya arenaria]
MEKTSFANSFSAATIEPEMTTRHPHHTQNPDHTHEPAVHKTISFFYDFHTHQMTLSKGTDCYIFALSLAERQDVHTDAGMTVLEYFLDKTPTVMYQCQNSSLDQLTLNADNAGLQLVIPESVAVCRKLESPYVVSCEGYKPKDTNAPGDDPTPDYMNLLGMIFSMCGLMMKAFHISGCDVISPEPPANDSTLAVILIPPDSVTCRHPGANISNPGIINIPFMIIS